MSHQKPVPRIINNQDLQIWIDSNTYNELVEFVTALAQSVRGKTNTDQDVLVSSNVESILNLLKEIELIVEKHPVVKDKEVSRFGKIEFRDFYDDLANAISSLLTKMIKDVDENNVTELATYLVESWGNRTRIDYGSGHELNFICFLLCLKKLEFINDADNQALVLRVFKKYMEIMRILQTRYWLEPAGSHGVWGLDDYHFLPFLFGASQLSTHEFLKPKSIHNKEVVHEFSEDYMYFECINFINQVKTESLRWHSPMLDDISAVRTWSKVEEGMMKMFKGEVLNKLPIIQHFLFGSLIKCPENVSEYAKDDAEHHAEHQHTFGDCCGIKVPSAFGAHLKNQTIPFD